MLHSPPIACPADRTSNCVVVRRHRLTVRNALPMSDMYSILQNRWQGCRPIRLGQEQTELKIYKPIVAPLLEDHMQCNL